MSAKAQEIDQKILRYLVGEDWPVTTEMIARALNISWNTAQLHLYKLMTEELIKGKKVGRQNQWMISEKGKEMIRKGKGRRSTKA